MSPRQIRRIVQDSRRSCLGSETDWSSLKNLAFVVPGSRVAVDNSTIPADEAAADDGHCEDEEPAPGFAACTFNSCFENFMALAELVHVDGTFCCQSKFQLITIWIRVKMDGKMWTLPLFNILMEGKSSEAYLAVFRLLKEMFPMFDPSVFTGDFERALWAAFAAIFNAIFGGCLFHLMGNVDKLMWSKAVPKKHHKLIRSLITELTMAPWESAFEGMKAKLASLLNCAGAITGYSALSGCSRFGASFFRNYLGGMKPAKVASPATWAAYARPLRVSEGSFHGDVVPLTNNPGELGNGCYASYMHLKCANSLPPRPFMAVLNNAVLEMFSVPLAYAKARDSAGMLRLPQECYKTRESASSLTAIASQTARAIDFSKASAPSLAVDLSHDCESEVEGEADVGLVLTGNVTVRASSRLRRASSRISFATVQHAHATLGTGGMKRKSAVVRGMAELPASATKVARCASAHAPGSSNSSLPACVTTALDAGSLDPPPVTNGGATFFAHLAALLVANPSTDVSMVGAGDAQAHPLARGDPHGNAAVWICSNGHTEARKVRLTAVRDHLFAADSTGLTMTKSDVARTANVDRSVLFLLRNGTATYGSVEEAVETERTPMSSDHTLAYDAEHGKLYLSEGNQRANYNRVGWSQVAVQGFHTVLVSDTEVEDMAMSIVGSDRPLRDAEEDRGLFVCADDDDRAMVHELLRIVTMFGMAHHSQIRACLGAVMGIVGAGGSAPVLPVRAAE
jgi:hypothetical protein